MSRATNLIEQGEILLLEEIKDLISQGYVINKNEHPHGYIFDDDTIIEMDIKAIKIVNNEIHVFLSIPQDKEDTEETIESLECSNLINGWYLLDKKGFFGLFLQTLYEIRIKLTPNESK